MTPLIAGVLFQLSALALFVLLDTATKLLTVSYPIPQIVFLRFLFHVLLVALALRIATGRVPWPTRAPGLQTIRSLLLLSANILFTIALSHIPLADAAAVSFASPLITVALAAIMLGERVTPRRWIGVAVGFVGVMVALRPPFLTGAAPPHWAIVLPLGTAAIFALYQILTRRLATVDSPSTTILHTGLAACAVTAFAQPFVWTAPTPGAWALMVAAGVFGGAGHWLLVQAYSRAPASLLAPVSYTQLIWATLASALFFMDPPDVWTLVGAGVIAAGGVVVAWPERKPGE